MTANFYDTSGSLLAFSFSPVFNKNQVIPRFEKNFYFYVSVQTAMLIIAADLLSVFLKRSLKHY